MSIVYKKDILELLKNKGYSSYKIRQEKIFGQRVLQQMRENTVSNSMDVLSKLCELLECQPSDIIKYVKDESKTE